MSRDAEEERALRWVGRAPEAAPSPEARERARAAFLTGQTTAVRDLTATRRRPARRRVLPLAIAAAAAGLVVWGAQPAERWVLVASEGEVTFAGARAPAGAEGASGLVTTGPGGSVEARLGNRLRVRITESSRVTLPPGPARWFSPRRIVHVDQGVFFASTAGSPLGFDLRVRTDEAVVDVVGTTFAVRRNELGTCVCLYEGHVEVQGPATGSVEVAQGQRALLRPKASSPVIEPLDEMETAMLRGLLARQSAAASS